MWEFSKKDLLRGKVITPGWYRVKIDDCLEAPSKDQKSTNWTMEGTIQFNSDNGNREFEGFPLTWNFNSKALGFATGYLAALGAEPEIGKRYDPKQTVGMELDIFVENEMYENRLVNRVNHKYRAPRPAEAAS